MYQTVIKPCTNFDLARELMPNLSTIAEEVTSYAQQNPQHFTKHSFCAMALVSWVNTKGEYSNAENAIPEDISVSDIELSNRLKGVCSQITRLFSGYKFDDSPILQIMSPGSTIMTHKDQIDINARSFIPYNLTLSGNAITTFYEQDRTTTLQTIDNTPGILTRFDNPDIPHNVRAGAEGRVSVTLMQLA